MVSRSERNGNRYVKNNFRVGERGRKGKMTKGIKYMNKPIKLRLKYVQNQINKYQKRISKYENKMYRLQEFWKICKMVELNNTKIISKK